MLSEQLSDKDNLSEIDRTNDTNSESQKCRAFWRSVILQAVVDSLSRRARTEYKLARDSAIRWFKYTPWDFKLICYLAEYNTRMVQERALSLINAQERDHNKVKLDPHTHNAEQSDDNNQSIAEHCYMHNITSTDHIQESIGPLTDMSDISSAMHVRERCNGEHSI